jgi:hypothetical protein
MRNACKISANNVNTIALTAKFGFAVNYRAASKFRIQERSNHESKICGVVIYKYHGISEFENEMFLSG